MKKYFVVEINDDDSIITYTQHYTKISAELDYQMFCKNHPDKSFEIITR